MPSGELHSKHTEETSVKHSNLSPKVSIEGIPLAWPPNLCINSVRSRLQLEEQYLRMQAHLFGVECEALQPSMNQNLAAISPDMDIHLPETSVRLAP